MFPNLIIDQETTICLNPVEKKQTKSPRKELQSFALEVLEQLEKLSECQKVCQQVSIGSLAEVLGCSERTIQRAIKELQKRELIIVRCCLNPHRRQVVNIYFLVDS